MLERDGYASESVLQQWHLVVAAMVYAGLVVYGSLVPFQYRPVPLDAAIERFQRLPYLELGIHSRSDWVANLLLFVPLAWSLSASITVDRPWLWRLPTAVLVVPLCFAFALLIEFVQIQFPPRTTSINDIVAETIGAIVGSALWLTTGQTTVDWCRRLWQAAGRRGWAGHVLPGYLAFLLFVHVMPLDLTISPVEVYHKYKEGRVNIIPFAGYPSQQDAIFKILNQIVYFAPLGFLMSAVKWESGSLWNRGGGVLMVGFVSAGICELAQLFVFTRFSDVTDVIIGGLAVGLGWWVGWHRHSWQRIVRRPWFVPVALLTWIGIAVMLEWWPFTFHLDFGYIRERAASVPRVLFADYYAGTDYNAFTQWLRKTLLFLPLGALLAVGVFPPNRALGLVAAGFLGLLASTLLEAGQLALPGRYASLTDVVVETIAAMVGAVAAQKAWQAMRSSEESINDY
jgi:VanZ family protein